MAVPATSSTDLGGAEITAYAPDHRVSLVITGGNQLEVVDLSDPANPVPLPDRTQTLPGDAQSVDVSGDLAAVAVAGSGLDPRLERGQVVFFSLAGQGSGVALSEAGAVEVGYLPDSLAFNADGTQLVVANEGEPGFFYGTAEGVDPPGSISVIDVDAANPAASTVTELGFDPAQTAYLQARGVRISGVPDTTAETGIEPEYVSISGSKAYVTLQENNAVAVVDLVTKKITEIRNLGIKDWSRGIPAATDVPFEIPYQAVGGLPAADPNFPDQQVVAGGLSGLFYDPTANLYYTITDRGPQANDIPDSFPVTAFQGQKIFQDPSFTPTIYSLSGDATGVELAGVLPLQVPYLDSNGQVQFRNATGIGELFSIDSTPGAELVSGVDDAAFTPDGSGGYTPVAPDAFGLDTESVVRFSAAGLNDGNPVFAVSDEYRPQIALFDAATGQLLQRFVPAGTDFTSISYEPGRGDVPGFTLDTLPEVYSSRQANRGFEGMAYNSTDGLLYAFIQSPLHPAGFNSQSTLRRILAVDPLNGSPQAEYLYIQYGAANQDKIGDAVYDPSRNVFYVIDRDSGTARNSNKSVLELDLSAASNVLGYDWLGALGVAQPELLDAVSLSSSLVSAGVAQVHQEELFNLPSIGTNPAFDKAEGLALLPDGSLVVGYDNDFLAQPGRPDNQLSFVTFTPQPIDTSDRDGGFNPAVRDVYGLRMADAIATFTYEGEVFTITANEGDGRVRPDTTNFEATLPDGSTYWYGTVDPGAGVQVLDSFPDPSDSTGATTLYVLPAEQLGFQSFTADQGDEFFLSSSQGAVADDDFFNDELRKSRLKTISDANRDSQDYTYGGRSFTIFDSKGNVVFDSGNQLEEIAVALGVYDDGRSDDKGTEPEGVTTAVIEGRTYAFVGLERATSSTVLVFDITNPYEPVYTDALLNPGSLSPEGLEFVPLASDGSGFLQVANEVSGTLDTFSVGNGDRFTLELFHLSDQEAQAAAIEDAPRLSAVYRALVNQDLGNDGLTDNSLFLSSGDQFIPGVFADASRELFGSPGVADILIQNELGIQASAFGNHEFDLGTGLVKGLIDGSAATYAPGLDPLIPAFQGTAFPYLSGNLDFSADPNLASLVVADGSDPQGKVISGSTKFVVGSELIGVVAATTPTLRSISSPGGVLTAPTPFSSQPTAEELDALAAEIQADVDALLAANPGMNKVILLSHMQVLSIEEQLASRLTNVDIIVGGGSNTRLFDETDAIRAGDSKQGDYPVGREGAGDTTILTAADGNPVALVNTDGSYKYLGRLVLDFDGNGHLLPESYDPTVSGAFATDDAGVAAVGGAGLEDPEIVAIVGEIQEAIVAKESNVFGISSVFLNGNRSGDEPDGVRTQETNLGNLTADANLAIANEIAQELGETQPVVLSIKNGGGIRSSIGQILVPPGGTEAVRLPNEEIPGVKPAGGISENDIAKTLAFNNNLALLTLTKSEIVDLLEHGVAALPNAGGQFLQISGVRFSFDPSELPGQRIVNAGIFDDSGNLLSELVRDGAIVGSENELFRIVTLDFLARGGDGYPFPDLSLPRVNYVNLGTGEGAVDTADGEATFAEDGTEQDALAEYLLDRYAPDSGVSFDQADTGRSEDLRIQNLEFATDSVLPPARVYGAPGSFAPTMLRDVLESPNNPALTITSLLTIGEAADEDSSSPFAYVPTGILDGIGAYDDGEGDYVVLVNSELGGDLGYAYDVGDISLRGARIHSLLVDKDVDDNPANGFQSAVVSGGVAYFTIYDANGDEVVDASQVNGGFSRFCSSTYLPALSFGGTRGFTDSIYLTGEESSGGLMWGLDVESEELWALPALGRAGWENAALVDTGSPDTVAVLLMDDNTAPLYLWVGTKSTALEASFLERNGLAASSGNLYTWVPGSAIPAGADGVPGSDDLLTLPVNAPGAGSWKLVGTGAEVAQLDEASLRATANGLGALQLSRLEDVSVNPATGQQAVFASTGNSAFGGADLLGNLLTLDLSEAFGADGLLTSEAVSTLRVILDPDRQVAGFEAINGPMDTDEERAAFGATVVRSPDNLDWSADGFVYVQEDRSVPAAFFATEESSIWKVAPGSVDPATGQAVAVRWAQIDRSAVPEVYGQSDSRPTDPGNWESSGILDVSGLYGAAPGTYFLASVQAHSLRDGNIGGASSLVEGGQLNLIQQNFLSPPPSPSPAPSPSPSPAPAPSEPPADSPIGSFASVEFLGDADDVAQGGAGNDFVSAGGGNDAVSGGAGNDDLRGNAGDDRLNGEEGDDFARGGQGRDNVSGGSGDDQLLGDRGSDEVIGGEGNDILNGNGGDDLLIGGAGADEFRLSRGNDVIQDFSFTEGDTLALLAGQSFTLGQDASGNALIIRDGFGTTTLQGISLADFEAITPSPVVFL